jgi:CheY-specific phosphatase CheX
MTEHLSISDWMEAVVTSSDELSTTMLGLSGVTAEAPEPKMPDSKFTSLISVIGNTDAVQIGVGGTMESCQLLVKALMGMEPEDENLPYEEITDAFGEIANILAGQVKTEINKKAPLDTNVGMPVLIDGTLSVPEESETLSANAMFGDIPVVLLVMKSNMNMQSLLEPS